MNKHNNPIMHLVYLFWHNPLALAFIMSMSLLLGAYGFQYLGGYPPCDLCWYQRYAHMAILVISGTGLMFGPISKRWNNIFAGATILALDASIAAAGYHAGVEQKWWRGPDTCTAAGLSQNTDLESLFDNMINTKIVLCDEISWQLFGVSMAGYNFLISLVVAGFVTAAIAANFKKTPKNRKNHG